MILNLSRDFLSSRKPCDQVSTWKIGWLTVESEDSEDLIHRLARLLEASVLELTSPNFNETPVEAGQKEKSCKKREHNQKDEINF